MTGWVYWPMECAPGLAKCVLSIILSAGALQAGSDLSCSKTANHLVMRIALGGDTAAQVYLGKKYVLGKCATHRAATGLLLLEAAASRGNVEAKTILAHLVLNAAETETDMLYANDLLTEVDRSKPAEGAN